MCGFQIVDVVERKRRLIVRFHSPPKKRRFMTKSSLDVNFIRIHIHHIAISFFTPPPIFPWVN